MKISITIIILLILLAGTATGEDWIALWTWDDSWVGMNTFSTWVVAKDVTV